MDSLNFSLVFDHYFLEALEARYAVLSEADMFSHAKVRLMDNVRNSHKDLLSAVAARFHDYLWCACCGEARHGHSYASQVIAELPVGSRHDSCEMALDYEPDARNWETMIEAFDGSLWHCSSYGGSKWQDIAEFGSQYGNVTDGFFVDHAIDLEHNGGNVFSKSVAMRQVGLVFDRGYVGDFRTFLDWKFGEDILDQVRHNTGTYQMYARLLTARTLRYIRKHFLIFEGIEIETPDGLGTDFPSENFEGIAYGSKHFEGLDDSNTSKCDECGCSIADDDVMVSPSGDYTYCEYCFHQKYTSCDCCCEYSRHVEDVVVGGGCSEYWCSDCVANNASTCDECGYLTSDSLIFEIDGKNVCEDCTKPCDHCGAYAVSNDMIQHRWGTVCKECNESPDFNPASLYKPKNDPAQPVLRLSFSF